MSSSYLTKNKIVEFAPNGPQTEPSEPNEQFIAMLFNEPRKGEQHNGFALELRNFTSDLVCITVASNFTHDHSLDKITIMYTYAFRSPQ